MKKRTYWRAVYDLDGGSHVRGEFGLRKTEVAARRDLFDFSAKGNVFYHGRIQRIVYDEASEEIAEHIDAGRCYTGD
jgi:hypothetical protein